MRACNPIIVIVAGVAIGWVGERVLSSSHASSQARSAPVSRTLDLTRSESSQHPAWLDLLNEDGPVDEVARLRALALALAVPSQDLAAELQALEDLSNSSYRNHLRMALIRRAVEKDPLAAWAICNGLPVEIKERLMGQLCLVWAEIDFEAALEAIETLKADPIYASLQAAVLNGGAKHSPQKAVEMALEFGFDESDYQFTTLFRNWAAASPAESLEMAKQFNGHGPYRQAIQSWAKDDPFAAFDYLLNSDRVMEEYERNSVIQSICNSVVENHPGSVLEWLQAIPPDAMAISSMQRLVSDTATALVEADQSELALQLLADRGEPADAYQATFKALARKDWHRAHAAAMELGEDLQPNAIKGLLEELHNEPARVIREHVEPLLEQVGNEHFYLSGSFLAKLETAEVIDLLERYPDRLKNAADRWIRDLGKQMEPLEAIAVLEQLPELELAQGRGMQSIVVDWAKEDPQAAGAWVATQPEGEARELSYQNMINAWSRQDAQGAMAWLEEQPHSSSRDAGLRELSSLYALGDPAFAWEASQSIQGDDLREQAMRDALEGMLWKQPEDAQAFIEDLDLSPETRERLNKRAEEFATWKRLGQPSNEADSPIGH